MAVQGNVFENGQWVTRTLDPRELLGPTSSTPGSRLQPPEPPSYGILSKTVIPSPVIRWVLPVQLRSSRNNDVAFIGDSFVRICELGRENQLQSMIIKDDFGSHIRNARVLGSPAHTGSNEEHDESRWQTPGDEDVEMSGLATSTSELPPQILVLVLERGTLVFLHIETTPQGGLEFHTSSHDIPDADWDHPGFQMTVDPSSRYLTLACPEDLFVVYELESMDTLRAQHRQRQPLSPVKSFRARAVRGVIHKLEFLFPAPDDDYHIILMMIVIRDKVARLVTYDWELGESLERVFQDEKRGCKLDEQWSMPLLVVPLTVQSSFMMITETLSTLVYNMPHGPPDYQTFRLQEQEESEYHFSSALPLWTAWARPRRDSSFHREADVIYLAREDGIFTILETSSELETSTLMGSVKCNIDTAFACLYDPHYDPHGDVLVTGGDCGPGAIWSVKPKQTPRQIATIPNWSPTVDLATTYAHPRDHSRGKPKRRGDAAAAASLRPDQVFACSGRGKSGAVTEFRHGLEASIGLEMDFEFPIKQCWEVPVSGQPVDEGLHLLVSSPNRSDVVFIPDDFSQAEILSQEQVPYDLASSTLACDTAEGMVIQVTSSAITVITTEDHTRHLPHEFYGPMPATIAHAAIRNNVVGMVLHGESQCRLQTLFVHGINTTKGTLCDVKGDVTCIALVKLGDAMAMVAGVWRDERPVLLICPVTGKDFEEPVEVDCFQDEHQLGSAAPANLATQLIEPLTSIVVVEETAEGSSVVVGTRSGDVFTLALHPDAPLRYRVSHEKYGPSAAEVFPFSTAAQPRSAFVCCNSNLAIMWHYSSHGEPLFEKRHRVVPTLMGRPDLAAPPINAVARLRHNLSSKPECVSVVLVSGTMIYIAELKTRPDPVLRHFPLGRKPAKVAYSHRLGVLMVLVCDEFDGNRPALLFIDPETGDDLSLPSHNNGYAVDYISGLGEQDTNVFSLTTWRYQKGGTDWEFLVISMETAQRRGQVLVISAIEDQSELGTHGRPKIRFCTKWKTSHYTEPIRAVATDSQGLFLCSGTTIYYEVIDLVEKKLRVAKQHALSSLASWMEVVEDRLHVVTIRHSLEIFDYKSDPDDETMTQLYNDPRAKNGLHCIQAGDRQVTLLSDVHREVHGIWIPPPDACRLRTIFSAELPVSVRRFGRCKARQPWETRNGQPRYGRAGADADASDIIGLAIDGSLQQFTLLSNEAWRLLSFLQQLALQSKKICPFGQRSPLADDGLDWNPLSQSERHPKMKHVDGDILWRCLDSRALELLLQQHMDRYKELLQGLEQGRYTQSLGSAEASGRDPYIELGYTILRYYLAPIL